jgi:hypothetical protein
MSARWRPHIAKIIGSGRMVESGIVRAAKQLHEKLNQHALEWERRRLNNLEWPLNTRLREALRGLHGP